MISAHLILVILALVCFLIAAVGYPAPRAFNLTAAGLFLWLLSELVR